MIRLSLASFKSFGMLFVSGAAHMLNVICRVSAISNVDLSIRGPISGPISASYVS